MRRLDDPALVAEEYADETRLRRRASAYTGETSAEDARVSVVAAVAEAAPGRVLEVGCGWVGLAAWIARETLADVVATDLSPRMVDLARERGVDASRTCRRFRSRTACSTRSSRHGCSTTSRISIARPPSSPVFCVPAGWSR